MDKHICCVVDTETTMRNEDHRLVYQIGWCISDLSDIETKDYHSRVFWVEETVENPEFFTFKTKRYSDNGVPLLNYKIDPRYKKVINGALRDSRIPVAMIDDRIIYRTAKWKDIIKVFNSDCKNLGVDSITAYNINFDFGVNGSVGAIRKTSHQFTDKGFWFPRDVKHFCLMDWVATLLINRDFYIWVDKLSPSQQVKMLTENSNYSYRAEAILRYLNNDLDYKEQHTALRDCYLEMHLCKIMYHRYSNTLNDFLGTAKKSKVKGVSWKTIQKKLTAKQKLEDRKEWLEQKELIQVKQLELKI